MAERTRRSSSSLDRTRQYGFGRLLLIARKDYSTRLREKLDAIGDGRYKPFPLTPYIDSEGTRIVELSKRMGISKQATARMVKEAEANGLVQQSPDPDDKRASLITFTPEGLRYIKVIRPLIKQIEREYEAMVGRENLKVTRSVLEMIAYGKSS